MQAHTQHSTAQDLTYLRGLHGAALLDCKLQKGHVAADLKQPEETGNKEPEGEAEHLE